MFRKAGIWIFTAAVALSLAVPARAAELQGEISVEVDSGLTDVTTRRLVLYRVGDETEGGYRITEEFGGGLVLYEDAFSPHLARMLSENQGNSGTFRMVDAANCALFTSVEPGLYLLVEEGDDPMILPYMTAMPQNDRWQVQAYPAVRYYATENPRMGQHPGPILGAFGMVFSGIGLAVCASVKRKK